MSPVASAIVATGQTDHVSRRLDCSMAEMAREAVDRCLQSRGISFDDIDAVVAGNMEMFEGIYLVDQFFVDALGALGKPLFKLNTGGKPASYIPWHTCPNCKRSLLITRFAQHLEKCLGISGRQSSRNAMAKLTGQNGGTGSGLGNTPLGSRMGTPAPGESSSANNPKTSSKTKGISPVKRLKGEKDDDADADDMDNDTPERRKMKKKSSYVKKADRDKPSSISTTTTSNGNGNGTLKVKLKTSSGGRPDLGDRKHSESSERGEGKRDRDADDVGGDSPKKKKIKLSLGPGGGGSKDRGRASASVEPSVRGASPE